MTADRSHDFPTQEAQEVGLNAAPSWLIPARVVNQSFEPLYRAPPRGIHHHVMKFALFTPPSGLRDLRVQKDKKDNDDDE